MFYIVTFVEHYPAFYVESVLYKMFLKLSWIIALAAQTSRV